MPDPWSRAAAAVKWRRRAAVASARQLPIRARAWVACRARLARYRILSEPELRTTRKSDIVFVFGSGASLNGLTAADWRAISGHDTIGFNWFVHERFVRCDYHLVREICTDDLDAPTCRAQLNEFGRLVQSNPNYAETVFLVQRGFRATNANRAIGLELLPRNARLFRWRSLRGRYEPSASLAAGLVHAHASLIECVNFAFLMGWRQIVLAGVDLYDRRYFWLEHDAPGSDGVACDAPHNTATTGTIELLGEWRAIFARLGIELFVLNPKSLLARTLPVWGGLPAAVVRRSR